MPLVLTLRRALANGPFTSAEIESLTRRMESAGAPAERLGILRRFMETDDGGQFLMVNLLHMANDADADANMDRYMAHMLPVLLKRASHPALHGSTVNVAMDVAGIQDAEQWTSFGIVRYRSRRDLLAIALDPAFSTVVGVINGAWRKP